MTSVIDFCGIFPSMQDRPVFSSCVSTECLVVIGRLAELLVFECISPVIFLSLAYLHFAALTLVGLCALQCIITILLISRCVQLSVCVMLKMKASQSLTVLLVWSLCIIAKLIFHPNQFMFSF